MEFKETISTHFVNSIEIHFTTYIYKTDLNPGERAFLGGKNK